MEASIADRGNQGEQDLNDWLRESGLSYVAICQSPKTFAPLFPGKVKRPDFLVLIDSIGLIAVDAKNYSYSGGVYTLGLDTELRPSLMFERLFRLPIWYAYRAVENDHVLWYWISALRAMEVGEVRTNKERKEDFLAITRDHFERLESRDDLGKLYTHGLRSLDSIARDTP